jgi:hypothetical protein
MVMIKKQAIAAGRQFGKTGLTTDQIWWNDMWNNIPRLETGYAFNQPKWPYWVKPCNYSAEEWLDMTDWMVETFGDADWSTPGGRWVGGDRKFWFRDAADRTLFLLKWSR